MPKQALTYGTMVHNSTIYGFIDIGISNRRTYFPVPDTNLNKQILVGRQTVSFKAVILANSENSLVRDRVATNIDIQFGGERYSGVGFITAVEQAGVLDGHIVFNVAGQFSEDTFPDMVINQPTISVAGSVFGPFVVQPSIIMTPGEIVALTATQGPQISILGDLVAPVPIGSFTDVFAPSFWIGFFRADWCVDLDGWAEGFGLEGRWEFLPATIVNEVLCNLRMQRIDPDFNAGYLFQMVPELEFLDRFIIEYDYYCLVTSNPDEFRVYGTDELGSPAVVLNSITPINDAAWHSVKIDVNPPTQAFHGVGIMPIALSGLGHTFYINNFRILRGDLAPIFIIPADVNSVASTFNPSTATVELYTIGSTGADYTTVSGFLQDHNTRDLVAEGVIIKGTFITDVGANAEGVSMASATMDENHYFWIDGAGFKVTYLATLPPTFGEVLYNITFVSIVIENLEIDLGFNSRGGIALISGVFHRVNNCTIHNSGNGVATPVYGLRSNSATGKVQFYNNFIYDFPTVDGGIYGIRVQGTPTSSLVANNTVHIDGTDFDTTIGIEVIPTTEVYNNASAIEPGNASPVVEDCFSGTPTTASNNASTDATAPGGDSHINQVLTDLFQDPGSDDYDPKVLGNLFDKGIPINGFNTDVIGSLRPQIEEWDIGAIERLVVLEEYTIGTGGDYATIQAFVAAHSARDFLDLGIIVKGTLISDLNLTSGISFSGADSTSRVCYWWIDGDGYVLTANYTSAAITLFADDNSCHIENIVFDMNNNEFGIAPLIFQNSDFAQANNCIIKNADVRFGVSFIAAGDELNIFNFFNNLIYDSVFDSVGASGIISTATVLDSNIFNNTFDNLDNPSGFLAVFDLNENLSNVGECRNNISVRGSASGTFFDFVVGGQFVSTNNVSEDTSAPGTNSHINQIAADLFEDITNDNYIPKITGNLFDLGIPEALVQDDVFSVPRPQDTANDIGAVEKIQSLSFDGDDWYDTPLPSDAQINGDWFFECFYFRPTSASGVGHIFSIGDLLGNTLAAISINVGITGAVSFNIINDADDDSLTLTVSGDLPADKWTKISVTKTGSSLVLRVGSGSDSGTIPTGTFSNFDVATFGALRHIFHVGDADPFEILVNGARVSNVRSDWWILGQMSTTNVTMTPADYGDEVADVVNDGSLGGFFRQTVAADRAEKL